MRTLIYFFPLCVFLPKISGQNKYNFYGNLDSYPSSVSSLPIKFSSYFPQQNNYSNNNNFNYWNYLQQFSPLSENQNVFKNNEDNIEITDVPPEYQRKILGWYEEPNFYKPNNVANFYGTHKRKSPRFKVSISTQAPIVEVSIPKNYTKFTSSKKEYHTEFKKVFSYDPINPDSQRPIHINLVNGEIITEEPIPQTTINEKPDEITSWYN